MNKFMRRRKTPLAISVGVVLLAFLLVFLSAVPASAASVADESTLTKWEQTTGDNTKNLGRIWTDKSVSTEDVKLLGGNAPEVAKGDSDFLVTLSALSSAGKITGAKTSIKPLDIVLVLDTSGSMADDMVTYTYTAVYSNNVNSNRTYYGLVEETGKYSEITRSYRRWYFNGQSVEPKTSANDDTEGHIQFYRRSSNDTGSKMQALKDAANAFIDSTAEANKTISGADKQHRISLVTFASSASTHQELTVCDTNNAASLKRTVNDLWANGGTQADDGMQQAQSALNGARGDAQKVVIFFTDGEPGDYGFTNSVANSAISTAKTLKSGENGALIYSIGMFGDADPSDTSENFNGYMHGISSNYPDATAWNSLGQRAENSNYYKSATNANELNEIFSKIFEEISIIEASSPVEEGVDGTENMAAITFHDELGDYMKVDDFKAIVFADQVFKDPNVMESPIEYEDKKVIQYEFTGKGGNTIYPEGDLAEIEITVERYNDPAKGDVVTVTIPASMIPLREYDVDTREGSKKMTIDDTYPLRIFYGASLKTEAETLLANPDKAMQDYIDTNKNDQGQVNFYSNKYYADGSNNGGVYVEFTPNDTNSFYYFEENEPLYLDEACTQRATAPMDTSGNTIYYYDRVYYSLQADGIPKEEHNIVQIPGDSNLVLGEFVKSDAEGLYVPSGTPRTTSLATHALNKVDVGGNTTKTAPYVTAPDWDDIYNPKNVIVKLGNNGILPVDLSGTLEVSKTVEVKEGNPDADTEFTFEITLNGNDDQSEYTAQKFNASGQADGAQQTITFADNKATVTLKAGEKIQLYGLTAGVDYTVEEKNLPKGFTAKDNKTSLNGEIAAGEKSSAAFVNEYAVEKLIIHNDELGLKGTKNITSTGDVEKVFEVGDIFRFDITPSDATNYPSPLPTPASATLEVKEDSTYKGATTAEISFGEFTFTEEGEYRYSIREHLATGAADDKIVPGIKYDTTNYRLILNVEDNGAGELEITRAQIAKNSGAPDDFDWDTIYDNPTLPEGDATHLVFNNTYEGEQQTISLAARKTMNKLLTDYSGAEQFGFVVTGAEEGQPMPTPATEGAYTGKYVYKNDTTGIITIPGITFEPEDAGVDGAEKEYTYYIKELQPTTNGLADGEAIDENAVFDDSTGEWTYKGVTFDNTTKKVKVKVSSKQGADGKEEVDVVIDYGAADNPDTTGVNEALPVFTNTYNASVEIAAITGTKKITGREFKANDEFTFNITANNGGPLPANVNDGKVTISPDSGETATIDFGKFTFDQDDMKDAEKTDTDGHASYQKTFEYTITEAAGLDAAIKYDTAARTLSITVRDDGYGNMTVTNTTVTPNTDGELVWTNEYTVSMDYSGINISKTLTGRMMKADEFEFTITPKDGTDTPALGASDASFKNGAKGDGVVDVMNKLSSLKFTQDDFEKTFTYIIDEIEPITDDDTDKAGIQSKGVTYDQSQYEVVIKPTDNGDGTMSADTTVTRIRNASGETVSEEVDIDAIAFNNTYAAGPGTLDGATALEVTKSFTGREENQWLESDAFTFNIEFVEAVNGGEESAVTMPANTSITINDTDADKKASFGDIKFAKTGTYTFKVSEDTTGLSNKGITAKTEPRIVKIVVSDPGDGTLVAVKDSTNSQALFFENTYKAGAATFENINVEKVLTGRPDGTWLDTDAFEFKLEAADEATTAAVNSGTVELPDTKIIDIKKDDTETADGYSEKFDAIKFTRAGEYFFKVTEIEGDISGIEYDTAEKVVNIKVTDNGEGGLVAKVVNADGTTSDSTTVTFTNTYTPGASDAVSTANLFKKVIDGRDWLDTDAFTFTITPQAGAPAPVDESGTAVTEVTVTSDTAKNGEEVPFEFGTITFSSDNMGGAASKTFTYKITENNGGKTENRLTYTDKEATMSITVTDNGTGKLSVSDTSITGITDGRFVNKYERESTAPVETTDLFTKVLTGRNWRDTDAFVFTITPQKDAPKPVDAESNKIDKVTVTSDSALENAKVKFDIGTIIFTDADMAGATIEDGVETKTFTYTIQEENAGQTINGMTYSDNIATMSITVKNEGNGKLTASDPSITAGDATFTNSYKEGSTGAADLFTKVLNGRDWNKDDAFKFTITGTDDTDPLPAEPTIEVKSSTAKNGEEVKFGFGQITFTADMLDGVEAGPDGNKTKTFVYNIKEDKAGTTEKGMTYSNNIAEMSIEVSVDEDGIVTVKEPVVKNEVFTNTYNAAIVDTASIGFTKAISGRDWDVNDEFTFKIETVDGPEAEKKETTVKKDGVDETTKTAPFDFGKIVFTSDDMTGATENADGTKTKEFTYTVTEKDLADTVMLGTTKDDNTATIKITVMLNENGTLAASEPEVDYRNFVNTYVEPVIPTAKAEISGIKKLLNESTQQPETLAADMFEFVLTPIEGTAGNPITVNNKTDGSFSFIKNFTEENTYTYTVTETSDKDSAVTYDKSQYKVVIEVTADAVGDLTATQSITKTHDKDGNQLEAPAENAAIEFTNYIDTTKPVDPPPTRPENGSISLTAKKILSGRDLAAGEFSFAVVDANGRTVATGSNKADGTIDFSRIIFTEAGIYEYDVKEINNNLGGVTYDDTLYHVQVIVQNIGGKLTPTSVQYQIVSGQAVSALVFNNVYKAGETGLSIGGTKILEGRKLKAGEFTFVLKDENGKTYKVVNDADGQFIFDQLVFDKAGTYVYSLYEQKGKDKEITYDGEEFLITVTVTDDLKGNLNASYVVTKDGKEVDAVAFTNTYEKAEEPDKPVTPDDPEDPDRPKTGDESGLALWTVLLILAAGAVPAVNAARKKAERK